MGNTTYSNLTCGWKGECEIGICRKNFLFLSLGRCVDNSFIIIRGRNEKNMCILGCNLESYRTMRVERKRLSDVVGRQASRSPQLLKTRDDLGTAHLDICFSQHGLVLGLTSKHLSSHWICSCLSQWRGIIDC